MEDTFARWGIVSHVQIYPTEYAISKGGPHYVKDRLFCDTDIARETS